MTANYLIHATKLLKAINFSQLGEALFDLSNVVKIHKSSKGDLICCKLCVLTCVYISVVLELE